MAKIISMEMAKILKEHEDRLKCAYCGKNVLLKDGTALCDFTLLEVNTLRKGENIETDGGQFDLIACGECANDVMGLDLSEEG